MVMLLASQHLVDLSKWQVCGCPACLEKRGLEVVEVFNPQTERYVRMVSRKNALLGCTGTGRQGNPRSLPQSTPQQSAQQPV